MMSETWDELIAEKQGRKLNRLMWACNCVWSSKRNNDGLTLKAYFPVQVVADGRCIHCGYYACKKELADMPL